MIKIDYFDKTKWNGLGMMVVPSFVVNAILDGWNSKYQIIRVAPIGASPIG